MRPRRGITLRLSPSQLIAHLPETMLGPGIKAAIYTLSGNKLVERNATNPGGVISVPINRLGNGGYFFEVSGAGKRFTAPFRISR